MNIWKLELLRLIRTQRFVVLLAFFILFGFIGPLTAKYLPQILGSSISGGVKVLIPNPTPLDGISQYLKNALQLGIVVVVIVSAYSLAIDAKAGISIFYRTRIIQPLTLLLPRFIVITIAVLIAFIIGTLTATYETVTLLGSVLAKDISIGTFYICLYWIFCISVVLLATSLVRGLLASVGLSLGILIFLPILESFSAIKQWTPTILSESMTSLLAHQQTASYYFQSAILASILIICFVLLSAILIINREIE